MRYVPAVILAFAVLVGCGAGHRDLKSMTITPTNASATTQGTVGYSATGIFTDNSTRILTVGDGLSWRTSNTAVAGIDDLGMADCRAAGNVTITASAPKNLQLTVNNGISNTAETIRATASLSCK